MKNEKRILIKEDRGLLNDIVQDLHRFKPTLSALTGAFEDLYMGVDFSDKIFKDLISNGLSNISISYKANLEKELDKTGVLNPILRKTVLSASEPVFNKFETAYTNLVNYTQPNNTISRITLTLENISFTDGKFVVTEAEQEILLENHCRVYLETEKEKAFYATITTLKDAFNGYFKAFQEYELDHKVQGFYGIETFLEFNEMDVSIKPESINYGVTISEKEKMKHTERMQIAQQKRDTEAENQRKFKAGELPGQILWKKLNEDLIN